ncbi:MAG: hypothetical protein JGK03_30755 [Microcoleus sp. PH2017_25_DOB_D_A]|uniref:hypothetical protein n=1 Tax=Microcoleus sp. PH2017_25_DOB_D_A TaxID=2798835 RepID=UPI001D5FB9B5|nr:hypothetical protein [Microcoleus sp. PH2017_25_DOB_D_A]MCC3538465.1 hypothetical protein [Microcoleus sp. PH2017_25_DOB_D_A]
MAKIAGNPTVRASPLAWKNTHRSRIKIGKNRWKSHSASVPARVEKYPSLADQNWQKSPEIAQCERPRSREKIPIARGSKLAKIAGNCTVRASPLAGKNSPIPSKNQQKLSEIPQCERPRSRGKIPIARVEKYPSLKNTHRSRGKIPIARVEKYPSLAWKNTHRSRGKININSVQESTSIVRQNQYIAFLKKMRYN